MSKIYLAAILITGLTALQTAGERGPRIKTVINMRAHNSSIGYTYMTNGYVETMTNTHGFVTSYFYTDSFIARHVSNIDETDTFTLNTEGLAQQSVGYLRSRFIYKYDADGFLIKSEGYVQGKPMGSDDWTIANANVQANTTHNAAGQVQSRTFFNYYPGKPNTIGNVNLGLGFLGRNSKNLIKETVRISPTGDTLEHLLYHYHFDKDNRANQKIIYTTTGQLVDSTSYIYFY